MIWDSSKVPVVLQMEATECGAASLAMVLASHGLWVTLEEARVACGTSRDGVNAASLLSAAQSYGLRAKALSREPEQLHELPMPQILHWKFEHFIVLERISGNKFHVVDPAVGRRVIPLADMQKYFTGLTIASVPGDDFQMGGSKPSVLTELIGEARRSPDAMLATFGTALAGVVPGLAMSGAVAVFVDHIATGDQSGWLPWLLLALVGVAAVQGGLTFLQSRIVASFKAKVATVSAVQSFWHALFLPISFFSQRSAGEIVSRLRLGSEVGGLVAGPLASMVPHILIAGIYLGVLAFYNVTIAAVCLAVCCFNLVVLTLIAQRVADRNKEQQIAEGYASGFATSGLSSVESYRTLGREDLLISRWAAAEDEALERHQRLGFLRSISELGPTASRLLLSAAVLGVGAFSVMSGDLSIGGLVAAQMIVGLLNGPVAAVASGYCQLQQGAGALMRLKDLNANPLDPAFMEVGEEQISGEIEGRLSFEGVSFGHAPDKPVVEGLSFDIEPGRLVALLGTSGSGKSTTARLASGLLSPWSGQITLDGIPLAHWPSEELRKHLVFVTQTPSVFTGSIADNISMWHEEIKNPDAVAAAQSAGLHEAILRHPAAYSTRITPEGGGLSGGEFQRLTLARALAMKPEVLILDETTSALDTQTEAEVLGALRQSGSTVLIVTHREGTAMRCDEALVLDEGRLAARGAPSDLVHFISEVSQEPQAVEQIELPAPATAVDSSPRQQIEPQAMRAIA